MSAPTTESIALCPQPERIDLLELPDRAGAGLSARAADLRLIAQAPPDFLDTTHFDTVRFPPPDWAAEQFAAASSDGSLAYTGYRGHADVLASVADTLRDFLSVDVDPRHNIILTPGTQAGLFCTLSALVEAGDRVALVDPDYLFSARILGFLGAEVAHIPLRLDESGPHLDLDALENEFATRGTRFLVFSHPNNPTGAVYSSRTIQKISELAVEHSATVLVDELYARLLHDDCDFPHLVAQPGMAQRTITLLGPSKTESLSGYRLGVVVAPAAVIARIENVLSITALRAPAYAQHVLLPWLRKDHAWLATRLKCFTALRDSTVASLRRLPWLELYPQQGTAYLWPDVSALGLPGTVVAETLLKEASVLISPGYQFGPASSGHFRVCYARDEQVWTRALDRMVAVLDGLAIQKGLPGCQSP